VNLLFLLALAVGPEAVEDFEDGLPEGWERISSDTHPPYNTIEIVRDPKAAKSGAHFLRMTTLRGSTAYRLSPRFGWTVDFSRPYRLSVFARLTGTRRNAAVATLTWLNAVGDRISEARSTPMTTPGEWTEIVLEFARVPAGAVTAAPRLDFEGDDVRGTCDFDRLVFAPVEHLDLRPDGRATAVFTPEEYPRFAVSVAGAAGSPHLTVRLTAASGATHRRSASSGGTVDFLPPGPGVHEVVASIDGSNVEQRLTMIVPNSWASTGEPLPEIPPALLSATLRGPLTDAEGRPTPAWLARRALQDVLEGATPIADPGLFPAGVRVAAFRKRESAVLALWTDGAPVEVPVTMNDGAKLYPPLGAIRSLGPGERLVVGSMPVFLVGLDPLLLELKLTLSGGDLPLQLSPAARTLRFHNPSRSQALLNVRLRIDDVPSGWRISPREISAPSVAPDGDLAEDLQFVLPASEVERFQQLRFEVSFVRSGKEHVVRLSRAVRLATALKIGSDVSDGPRPGSKKLTVRVTNASDRPMTLTMRARIPQHAEQNELLRDLAPGATSAPFVYVVRDVSLLDPAHVTAEVDVQEPVGDRAAARRLVPLR
jgi:hypothetical protein